MSITQEEIEKISKKLAKLKPKNTRKLVSDINSILKYIDLLNEVNTTWVVPTVNIMDSNKQITLRNDEIKKDIESKHILNCSNQKIIANQIAVSDIMK